MLCRSGAVLSHGPPSSNYSQYMWMQWTFNSGNSCGDKGKRRMERTVKSWVLKLRWLVEPTWSDVLSLFENNVHKEKARLIKETLFYHFYFSTTKHLLQEITKWNLKLHLLLKLNNKCYISQFRTCQMRECLFEYINLVIDFVSVDCLLQYKCIYLHIWISLLLKLIIIMNKQLQ